MTDLPRIVTDFVNAQWHRLDAAAPLVHFIELGGFAVTTSTSAFALVRRHQNRRREGIFVAKAARGKVYAEAASKAVHKLWSADPLLSKEEYWELVRHNPEILVSIIDSKHKMVGFFDVFPLKSDVAEAFLRGETTERALLTKQSVYELHDSGNSDYIYIGTVLALPGKLRASERLRLELSMVRTLLDYVIDKFPPRPGRTYFALSATRLGIEWLEACEFTAVATPSFSGRKARIVYELRSENVHRAHRAAKRLKPQAGNLYRIRRAWQESSRGGWLSTARRSRSNQIREDNAA